ncbi:unnamed protein product [Caenorhabditis brenneri]
MENCTTNTTECDPVPSWDPVLTFALYIVPLAYFAIFPFYVIRFVLDNLPIATASLYIPLILKIRKSAHLASAQLNRPQRYVFWQLIVISMQRLIFVPVISYAFSSSSSSLLDGLSNSALNLIFTPFITQICYLGCNRRTVESLLNSMTADNFLKMLCCPCFKPSLARVDVVGETPIIYHVSSTQMDS